MPLATFQKCKGKEGVCKGLHSDLPEVETPLRAIEPGTEVQTLELTAKRTWLLLSVLQSHLHIMEACVAA